MFRRGGFGLPTIDSPVELMIALLIFALLIWLVYRLVTN
jgi:flagellar biogenesis protein FliO